MSEDRNDRSTASSYRVLAIDDERPILDAMRRLLRSRGFEIEPYQSPRPALEALDLDPFGYDLVLLDVNIPGDMNGLQLIEEINRRAPGLPIVMFTGDPKAETAVAALKAGAHDYLTKPLPYDAEEYLHKLRHAGRDGRTRRDLHAQGDTNLIGNSKPMQELRRDINRAAMNDPVSVLVRGETGTGKELVAREIHQLGPRRDRQWYVLNCGAIPRDLIDSELFGTRRGAFTDAGDKAGAFEQAHKSSLFLDEIAEVPIQSQPSFLRVLEEREVRRLGAEGSPRQVDVRIIAATNKDLEREIADGNFREDLYYRLNVLEILIPPLRDRLDDIVLLARHFAKRYAATHNKAHEYRFTDDAVAAMKSYDWPGNIRQFSNTIIRACMDAPGPVIELEHVVDHVPIARRTTTGPGRAATAPPVETADTARVDWAFDLALTDALEKVKIDFLRDYLTELLTRTEGNVSEAARIAQRDRANFRRLLRSCGIDPETYRT